jgi:hypothetical protein
VVATDCYIGEDDNELLEFSNKNNLNTPLEPK